MNISDRQTKYHQQAQEDHNPISFSMANCGWIRARVLAVIMPLAATTDQTISDNISKNRISTRISNASQQSSNHARNVRAAKRRRCRAQSTGLTCNANFQLLPIAVDEDNQRQIYRQCRAE